jgi:BASS family bile acid:Na+ symporter
MQALDTVRINFGQEGIWLLNVVLAIVMFGVALGISGDDIRNLIKKPKLILLGLLSQLIILPLITFIFVLLIKPDASIALGMLMVAACPGGNISNFMTHLAKGNTALSVSLTAIATLLAIVMTPFNFQFYGNLYAPTAEILRNIELDLLELFKVVFLVLGLPLAIGIAIRYKYSTLAQKVSNILKPFSILVFITFVIIAFSRNLDVFYSYLHYVISFGVVQNILALASGYILARFFMLAGKDRKTLTLETGIQNSGLGLLLTFNFFEELGGMAMMVAFYGIWHIITGLLVALFWARD